MTPSLFELEHNSAFIRRHIGPNEEDVAEMLAVIGADSLDELMAQTLPANIMHAQPLGIGPSRTEVAALAYLKSLAQQNCLYKSYIGMGYHDTLVPLVIQRNVLENPGWYTAYTPYQPEIAQGRLHALLNFQQMTQDLTGLDLANASLLDEATAAAEAMALARRVSKNKASNTFFIADDVHPQTIDVVQERAAHYGFDIVLAPAEAVLKLSVFGALLQYPATSGQIRDLRPLIAQVQAQNGIACVAADILSLVLLTAPGELGADVVLGSSQRFGVPMGYGGPHAAFFATREAYKRSLPGRIIGVSRDARGKPALRMALQTREQHIRREKANSNICTAQVLLANMSSFYAVYHGPEGLKRIAERVHRLTDILALGLLEHGLVLKHDTWFDTLTVLMTASDKEAITARALSLGVNVRTDLPQALGVSLSETTRREDVLELFDIFLGSDHGLSLEALDARAMAMPGSIPAELVRQSAILSHEVFNRYHSETEMLRYIHQLEMQDMALNHSMIALGSCTMKLNATAEMLPVSWPELAQMHPFAPLEQCQGYRLIIGELEHWLARITGYDAVCMQPNSGAQGEYAGLLAIKKYHESRGEGQRDICLIPSSAHGTNPASAQMANMKVIVVACDPLGNVDMADLKAKAAEAGAQLSCIMVTYPSTHGVYEENIRDICSLIHQQGGQVYLDGANMNAQVGLTSPGFIGADVSHLNLHKTFAIPHGGGGPGMGPIGVKAHLAPFVAGHAVVKTDNISRDNGAVAAAPFGSASLLPISWMYIALLGDAGLKRATQLAILNANYLMTRLAEDYAILYTGRNGRVAHECIVDVRPLKDSSGISELDIAKRLNDFGFHAPTMSFPVAGTLMIEPTESESKTEIDRFIAAMKQIRHEIRQIENGTWTRSDNPLVHAPHTQADLMDAQWNRAYSREQAAFPTAQVQAAKFWPTVNRIDDVYGDRHLFCSCLPTASYR